MDLESLPYIYYKEGLYESCIIISESIGRNKYLDLICLCLFELKHYKALVNTVIANEESLIGIYEIQKVYLDSLRMVKQVNYLTLPKITKNILIDTKNITINKNAVILLKLSKTGTSKRTDLIKKSFSTENLLFESLIALKRELFFETTEILEFIEKVENKDLKRLYKSIFTNQIKTPFSLFNYFLKAEEFFIKGECENIFKLGAKLIENFDNSEVGYLILGLAYLLKKQYQDARNCFYEAIIKDFNFGVGFLFLGQSYSYLKESVNAVESYSKANVLLNNNYRVQYLLAREYKKMANTEISKGHFKRSLKIKPTKIVLKSYVDLLVANYETEEAIKIIESYELEYQIALVFCYIITEDLTTALQKLEELQKTKEYYLILGFINHLKEKKTEAIENYSKAINLGIDSKILEGLISNITEKPDSEKRKPHDFTIYVFDSINTDSKHLCII